MASRIKREAPVTVSDVLDGHVKLDLECLDRVYLHGYLGRLQVGGQLVQFLRHRGYPIPSGACLQQIGEAFRRRVASFAEANHILVVPLKAADRNIEVMQPYLDAAARTGRSQVAAIGVAQEIGPGRDNTRERDGQRRQRGGYYALSRHVIRRSHARPGLPAQLPHGDVRSGSRQAQFHRTVEAADHRRGPVLFLADGKVFLVIGSPAGARKVTALIQALLNMTDFGHDVQQAVSSNRVHTEDEPRTVIVEPHFPREPLMGLARMGHRIRFDWYTARLAAIARTPDGRLEGGTDPRGDQALAVVQAASKEMKNP